MLQDMVKTDPMVRPVYFSVMESLPPLGTGHVIAEKELQIPVFKSI